MNLPSLPAFLSALTLQFLGMKTAPCHNRPQRAQHRVSLPRKCYDATRPTEWAHKPSQGLTRAFAVLDRSARDADGWSLAENSPTKICCLVSDFLNLLSVLRLLRRMSL